MSSSDPPQLRLSLPQTASTFKRSFEQFGFDLEPPIDSTVVASSSSTDEHRPGPSNGDRNKRARSSSVTPSSTEQTRSMDSSPSASSSHTVSSGPSNHAVANHRDAPPATAPTRHPQALENDSAFSSSVAGELSHTSSGLFDARPPEASSIEPPTSSVWSNPPSSANSSIEHNEQFRLSMERFHAFDSQISSIRSRPSPLPFHIPPSPTLPPLTLSSSAEHSHSHSHLGAAVSLPSVESLSYASTTAQTSASVPPPTAPPSTATPSDQYHSGVSSVGFEEFGEFREMMGFFPEQRPNSPSVDRPAARPRHQSPSMLDGPERPQMDRPFRRPPSRQIAENIISRNSNLHSWPSNRRGAALGDSDDEFGGRPVVPNLQGRGSLDLPRSRLDSSLLANRIRRSMQSQAVYPAPNRMSPPRFPAAAVTSSQIEPNSTQVVNNFRAQEPERFESWSSHPPRRPVFAEAFRTLAERLGRGRQRTNHTADSGAERSRSPVGGVSSSPYPCCTISMGSLIEPKSLPLPQAQHLLPTMIGFMAFLTFHLQKICLMDWIFRCHPIGSRKRLLTQDNLCHHPVFSEIPQFQGKRHGGVHFLQMMRRKIVF